MKDVNNSIPVVSVIIPVYNEKKHIDELFDSIANQTIENIEVIFVDDESTDGSYEIAQEYSRRDKRVQVYRQHKCNAGAARNLGMKKARGKYLYFVDADDFVEKNLLKYVVDRIEKTESDICIFKAKSYDDKKCEISSIEDSLILCNCPKGNPFAPFEMKDYLFNSFQNWTWNKLFSHEYIKRAGISFQEIDRTNDLVFVNMALAKAERIVVVNEELIYYRTSYDKSLQATYDKTPTDFIYAYKCLKNELKKSGLFELYKISFFRTLLEAIYFHANSLRTESAYKYLIYVIKYGVENEFKILENKEDLFNPKHISFYKELIRFEDIISFEDRGKREELENLKNSISYKIGRIITALPRFVRRMIKHREHKK